MFSTAKGMPQGPRSRDPAAAKDRATTDFDANDREDVLMQRMRSVIVQGGFVLPLFCLGTIGLPARADLIRTNPGRSFPDIAGDIVGTQTYTYDPSTQTGTFALVNAPHLISLGPKVKDLVQMRPDRDGTLSQSLQMKLDRQGHLVDSPANKFEIRGTVVIGDRTYQGLLLEGKPTAFGAGAQDPSAVKDPDIFDLDVQITGGKLAEAFGSQAYLRIIPQANSTFNGEFTSDFSGEKPLTNLRARSGKMPTSVPEPTTLITLLTCGAGLLGCRLRRCLRGRRLQRGCRSDCQSSHSHGIRPR
jgi:hypothetical protein